MFSQVGKLKMKRIFLDRDTVYIDSMLILPKSIQITESFVGNSNSGKIHIDRSLGLIICDSAFRSKNDSIHVIYRSIGIKKEEEFYIRKYDSTQRALLWSPTKRKDPNTVFQDLMGNNQLEKSGGVSRGITFGNQQDAAINSDLNLQLSGKLNDKISILAAISDKNIPVQAEGNSQNLQEFDRIYIKIFGSRFWLLGGDFELPKPESYFLKLDRKLQGLSFHLESAKKKKFHWVQNYSAAISKGRFNRNSFLGIEKNQGPYKLSGSNNELYITIISGSEKVYIDGLLLTRGEDEDYTIDYNLGEIFFTAQNLITKDKRIVVEFEYTDKNYARFALSVSNQLNWKKNRLWFNYFAEFDAANQPLQYELNDSDKRLLFDSGDFLQSTFVAKTDSIAFDENIVLYQKKDTLIDGFIFSDIFVFSNSPEKAKYRLTFSMVGQYQGNYRQITANVNGRVFEWVAPLDGIPQGDFEPVIRLLAPQSRQVFNAGFMHTIKKNIAFFSESAITILDKNTLSPMDDADNLGFANLFKFGNLHTGKDSSKKILKFLAEYEFSSKKFEMPQRYKSVEFERNWNLRQSYPSSQHRTLLSVTFLPNKNLFSNLNSELLIFPEKLISTKNQWIGRFKFKKLELNGQSTLTNSSDSLFRANFFRNTYQISQMFYKWKAGYNVSNESNIWKHKSNDSIALNSFRFLQNEVFVQRGDTLSQGLKLWYRNRKDELPKEDKLVIAHVANEFAVESDFEGKASKLNLTLIYRKLEVNDTLLSKNKEDNTLAGRSNFKIKALYNSLSINIFNEIGTGLEQKKDYIFIEVNQGQGIYKWIDYDEDGIKDKDEFEIANFTDEAQFLRVFIPTQQYDKVWNNKLSFSANFNPNAYFAKKKIKTLWSKMVGKINNQFSFRNDIKEKEFRFNSFFQSDENSSSLMSENNSLRNIFSFNRSNNKFGADWLFQSSKNRNFLGDGFETKKNKLHEISCRSLLYKKFDLTNSYIFGSKSFLSQQFTSKNYLMHYFQDEIQMNYLQSQAFAYGFQFKHVEKKNVEGNQKLSGNYYTLVSSWKSPGKSSWEFKLTWANLDYKTEGEDKLAYIFLEGLEAGRNLVLNLIFNRSLGKNLQMNLLYTGRKINQKKMIHNGGFTLRAMF